MNGAMFVVACMHREKATCNDGSGLEGFAQAHVISQAAVQASAAQEGQPGDALLLVGP